MTIIFILVFFLIILIMMTKYNQYITRLLVGHKVSFYYGNRQTISKTPIYIFMHICNVGNTWKDIISEQIYKLVECGLYNKATAIYYGCSCNNCDLVFEKLLSKYKKITKLKPQTNITHENETINEIIDFSRKSKFNCNILYIHSKGVTGKSANQNYWRDYMTNYTVRQWKACTNLLDDGYYTVGTNHRKYLNNIYAGNFWWATTDYLQTLEPVTQKTDRMKAEFKLLENYTPNKHINIGNEYWISTVLFGPIKTGLYSPIEHDLESNYREHEYYIENPDKLPISIF